MILIFLFANHAGELFGERRLELALVVVSVSDLGGVGQILQQHLGVAGRIRQLQQQPAGIVPRPQSAHQLLTAHRPGPRQAC